MTVAFHAVVLAGDRGQDDPVARHTGAPCKALVEVGGHPMLLRVLDALGACTAVRGITLVGPHAEQVAKCDELAKRIARNEVTWLPPQPSPSLSAAAALEQLPLDRPVLLTTADHALLQPGWVDDFCARALAGGSDAAIGLAPHAAVGAAFPGSRRTALRFRDGAYCGCNLFAFMSAAGRRAPAFWRQLEQQRKQPHRLAAALGTGTLVAYLLGRLTLAGALSRLSGRVGARLDAVVLDEPAAAVDVDSVADYELVQRIVSGDTVVRC